MTDGLWVRFERVLKEIEEDEETAWEAICEDPFWDLHKEIVQERIREMAERLAASVARNPRPLEETERLEASVGECPPLTLREKLERRL